MGNCTLHLGTFGEETSSILKYPWSTKNEPLCDFHVFNSSFFYFGRVRTKRTAWTWNILIKRHIDSIFPNWPFSQVLLLECCQHRHLFSIHHRWPITVQKVPDSPHHASYALKEENIALGYLQCQRSKIRGWLLNWLFGWWNIMKDGLMIRGGWNPA